MSQLTMNHLIECFNHAKEVGSNFVAVAVRIKGAKENEYIINHAENLDAKLEYYQKTYDYGLDHKHADGISIVGFAHGKTFHDIQKEMASKGYLKQSIA